jgi:GMP synthase-like glutamine amidotransferase
MTPNAKKNRIGILNVGNPPDELRDEYPIYGGMFAEQLSALNPNMEAKVYQVLEGTVPNSASECDGWLISGSRHGVYEAHNWIPILTKLIQDAYAANIPLVGICFGHQLIAQALGGKVVKSEKGWSLGVTDYRFCKPPQWIENPPETLTFQAYHQDQVVELPRTATVIAESDFCPYAGLLYANSKTISFQGHPEFSSEYMEKLLQIRRGEKLAAELVDPALKNIHQPMNNTLIMQWIADFLVDAQQQ